MARKTPAVRPYQLAKMTDIPPSTLSRLLTPTKVMTIQQLDAICRALGLDTGSVLNSASRTVAEHEAERLRESIQPEPPRVANGH